MMRSTYSTRRRGPTAHGHKRSFSGPKRSFGERSFSGKGRPAFRRRNPYSGAPIRHEMYISKVNAVTTVQESVYQNEMTFSDFALHQTILTNITSKKYVHPTKIQAQVINHILAKRDIIALSSTGSGKTGAFLIPIIHNLISDKQTRCLILAPTRELVNQIQTEFRTFSQNSFINDVMITGGASYATQIRVLRKRPQLVIATPGRLLDLYEHKQIDFKDFDMIVLDEVDQMLDMGFINDIKLVISKLKPTRQSMFFSATMNAKAKEIASTLLRNPVSFEINKQSAVTNVDQDIVKISSGKDKLDILHGILVNAEFHKVLIFSRTKRGADEVALDLRKRGHKADALHGNKTLGQRTKILSMFRRDEIDILVATDVASRGVDIPDISHVINFDEPATYQDYIHRIGRTGRIGKKGIALTFVK